MAYVRKQTVTFTFAARAPSGVEFWSFLEQKYGIELCELMMVQEETNGRRVHVKFVDEKRAEQVAESGETEFVYKDGSTVKVMVQGPSEAVRIVRVRNLPMEVSAIEVSLALNQYGKVVDCNDERYPRGSCFQGLLTGNRVVKMVVKRNIPSYVRVAGTEAMVFYQGQKPTCQICASEDHFRGACPNKKRPLSWAERAQGRKDAADDVSKDGDAETAALSQTPSEQRNGYASFVYDERTKQTTPADGTAPVSTVDQENGAATVSTEHQENGVTMDTEDDTADSAMVPQVTSDESNDPFTFQPLEPHSLSMARIDEMLKSLSEQTDAVKTRSRTASTASQSSEDGGDAAGREAKLRRTSSRPGTATTKALQSFKSLSNNPNVSEATLKRAAARAAKEASQGGSNKKKPTPSFLSSK